MILKDNIVSTIISIYNMGPKVYGIFNLGRVEHYFPVNK